MPPFLHAHPQIPGKSVPSVPRIMVAYPHLPKQVFRECLATLPEHFVSISLSWNYRKPVSFLRASTQLTNAFSDHHGRFSIRPFYRPHHRIDGCTAHGRYRASCLPISIIVFVSESS